MIVVLCVFQVNLLAVKATDLVVVLRVLLVEEASAPGRTPALAVRHSFIVRSASAALRPDHFLPVPELGDKVLGRVAFPLYGGEVAGLGAGRAFAVAELPCAVTS